MKIIAIAIIAMIVISVLGKLTAILHHPSFK